jgi:CBS domain-containing protein
MNTVTTQDRKHFLDLTAADVMSRPVMTIPHGMSLGEAARLLSGSNISGAPVVDAEGRCIGVLSSSDFVTWAGQEGEVTNFIAPWGEIIDISDFPDNEIRHYMTAQPIVVTPTAPIGVLAKTMADAHIHRILVVEEQDRPCGIVTSTDILAAVAQSVGEAPPQKAKGKIRRGTKANSH